MDGNQDITDFNFYTVRENDLTNRFPAYVNGYGQWIEFVNNLPNASDAVLEDPAVKIEDFQFKPPTTVHKIDCPRVFISHKQGDEHFAIRTAELAVQERLFYWLDVFDPILQSITPGKNGASINSHLVYLSPLQLSLLTAAIIEMALINCTHVIALITEKSRPSRWIPYEYGRAKNSPTIVGDTACWVSPKIDRKDIAEYMLLGRINDTDRAVKHWFNYEYYEFAMRKIKIPGKICNGGARQWTAANIKLESLPDDLS